MNDQYNSCDRENIIHQLFKVQAQVNVKPLVKHGIPKVYCVDSCLKPCFSSCNEASDDFAFGDYDHKCNGNNASEHNCNYTLTQLICIEIPISFGADVDIKKGITCCGNPDINSDCLDDFKDDISRNPIHILMNNKIPF